uniref:Retinol dehydrogenase 16 n=1 Tax=Prolemur simus TaxID=1328070 RepID=A0A8C9AM61_PROSS
MRVFPEGWGSQVAAVRSNRWGFSLSTEQGALTDPRVLLRLWLTSHFPDKYVLITGCGSGFGNLLARQLDMRGLRVLAACLTEKGAEQLRAQTSDRLETVSLDVTRTESISAAAQWCCSLIFPLSLGLWDLVNNAGICVPSAPNEWLTKQDFVAILDVNLLGTIEVTLSLLPLVRKVRGHVVNVSSVVGRLCIVGGGYSISKYGVEAFSDSLRRELAHFGLKVAVVEPGFFQTNVTNCESFLAGPGGLGPGQPRDQGPHSQGAVWSTGHLEKESRNLSEVTDCMEHALTACHPRTRYSAGWDAKLFYLPMSYMPTFLADAILT